MIFFAVWQIFTTFANMKPAKIFQQYVWLVNTLRQYKRLTLEEINNLWVKNDVIGGSLEVMEPSDLRLKICKNLKETLNKY